MSENRSIQRLDPSGQRAGAIMTPQGPAIIQVIDIPSGGGSLGMPGAPMPGMPAGRKVGGINIVGAILRRWWLVLLMTALIGGAGMFAAQNLMKPVYKANCRISWIDRTPDGQGMGRMVKQASDIITSRDIALMAAADRELQDALPTLLGQPARDLNDPVVQSDVLKQLKDIVTVDVSILTQVVDITCVRQNSMEASRICNAFARAFIRYCDDQIKGDLTTQIQQADQLVQENRSQKGVLTKTKQELTLKYKLDTEPATYANLMAQAAKATDEQLAAQVQHAAAQAKLRELENSGIRRPDQELAALKMIEEAEEKDSVLMAYKQQLLSFIGTLESEKAVKKDEHPDVKRARDAVNRQQAMIFQRKAEISAKIREQIDEKFRLMDAKTVAEAKEKVDAAQKLLEVYNEQLAKMDKKAQELVWVKAQIQALDDQIAMIGREHDTNFQALQEVKKQLQYLVSNTSIKIAELSQPPDKPDQDKRTKVQAAGMIGGLFLGMLLALLVDKFDKRLRDPRDIEPLLGAPLLGTIPKINELKRMKGEHARNLIAEEFRIIRTQLLFGNPELQHKIIAVTSPQPGDGKTSLSVNLAISIAKAGRRVLLIDGDLRKPDIHRIFNISDSPGFAEVIAGSHEPGTCIRKSDIDGLDVLPAGTPIVRPSELLSRPEVARVLSALGEVYDHVILDTAPLLPVSDTHVLVGIVDGVMCSFNAEIDRDTVTLVQDILRRCRAHVIGTVMNQVRYRQSGSYYRGKRAYSSYYTSTRVPPAGPQLPPGGGGIASLK